MLRCKWRRKTNACQPPLSPSDPHPSHSCLHYSSSSLLLPSDPPLYSPVPYPTPPKFSSPPASLLTVSSHIYPPPSCITPALSFPLLLSFPSHSHSLHSPLVPSPPWTFPFFSIPLSSSLSPLPSHFPLTRSYSPPQAHHSLQRHFSLTLHLFSLLSSLLGLFPSCGIVLPVARSPLYPRHAGLP